MASPSLRQLLDRPELLVLPGVANALAARVVEDLGFEAMYVTGAGVANTFLGMPDIGLLTMTQMVDHVAAIRNSVGLPLVVDADTGYGNAVTVTYAVSVLERAGANAIQLEDQIFPKRCGHFAGKQVVPAEEMVAKIKAAVDTRRSEDFLVVARTDARATNGLAEALDRGHRYAEAGADVIFVEAPTSVAEMREVAGSFELPTVVNIVHGGTTPNLPQRELAEMGFSIALYANVGLLGAIGGMGAALGALRRGEIDFPAAATWEERQRLVGKSRFDDLDQRYATTSPGSRP